MLERSRIALMAAGLERSRRWRAPQILFGTTLVVAFALPGCGLVEGKSCTLVACSSSVGTTLDVSMSPKELDGMRLELCHNERCAHAAMTFGASGRELHCTAMVAGLGSVSCGYPVEVTASDTRITVGYSVASRDDLRDGDTFTVRIMDPSMSVTFAEKSGTIARYEVVHPNGEECDGDYYCRSGTF